MMLYQFQGSEKVLELGCGDGNYAVEISKSLSKGAVVGLEFSKQVIDAAKKKHLQAPSRLSFKYQEWDKLAFSEKFDLVTILHLEPLLLDQDLLLKEVSELVKEGGYFLVRVPTRLPVALESSIKAIVTEEKWLDHFATLTPSWKLHKKEEYQKLLEKMKFSVIATKKVTVEEVFMSVSQFHHFILAALPEYKELTPALRKELVAQCADRYLKIFPVDAEGRVHFLVEKCEMLAQRVLKS